LLRDTQKHEMSGGESRGVEEKGGGGGGTTNRPPPFFVLHPSRPTPLWASVRGSSRWRLQMPNNLSEIRGADKVCTAATTLRGLLPRGRASFSPDKTTEHTHRCTLNGTLHCSMRLLHTQHLRKVAGCCLSQVLHEDTCIETDKLHRTSNSFHTVLSAL